MGATQQDGVKIRNTEVDWQGSGAHWSLKALTVWACQTWGGVGREWKSLDREAWRKELDTTEMT